MWSADHAKCCWQPTYKHSSLVHWYPQTNQSCSLVKHSFIIALPFGAWLFFCVGVGLVKLRGCKELKNLAASVSTSHLPVFDHFRVDRLIQRHPLITFSQHEEKVERKSQVQPSRHLHPFAQIQMYDGNIPGLITNEMAVSNFKNTM